MDEHAVGYSIAVALASAVSTIATLAIKSFFEDRKETRKEKTDIRIHTSEEWKEIADKWQEEVVGTRQEIHGLRNELAIEKGERYKLGVECAKMSERIATLEDMLRQHAPNVPFKPWGSSASNATFDIPHT